MAQASGAQREPSMEEILSSIRRIIEDSDAGAKSAEAAAEALADKPKVQSDGAVGAPAGSAPKSLADIQKEVVREQQTIQGSQAPATAEVASSEDRAEVNDREEVAETINPGQAESAGIETIEIAELDSGDDDGSDMSVEEGVWSKALREDAESGETDRKNEMAAASAVGIPPAGDAVRSSAGGILSADAGRRVAASFEQLSEAFMENRAKAFDGMAEEMLRPMLQEWLDENLPTLVERLVREEIERVARGGV